MYFSTKILNHKQNDEWNTDWTGEVQSGVMMATIVEMINNGDKDPPYVVLSGITANPDHYPRKHAPR